ncbi:MAG: thermonuclease family protein [Candidatus Poribacteria bacterium]|nr:thermonuclease family protein [Candidatus Poribacteria bacterium]
MRLAGIDTPELNAETEQEKKEAIQSRNYLESLILGKEIIVLFEKSDTTLDGIHRGAFGRPIAYIFILEDKVLPTVKTFVNQNMIENGNAIRSEYAVDFPVLFTEDFDVSDISVNAWVNANIGKASVNPTRRATATWAELKR